MRDAYGPSGALSVIAQHVLDLPDPSRGVAVELGLVGMGIFLLLVVGVCVYLAWKLPRRGDDGAPGAGGPTRGAPNDD